MSVVLLASIAPALTLAGCMLYRDSDNVAGPETDFPPHCSIVSIALESELLTSKHGGYVDMSLTVQNCVGVTPAYNLRVEIDAEEGNQSVGTVSIDLGDLESGQTARADVQVPVSASPDEVFCTLTWEDAEGTRYSGIADFKLNGGWLLKSPPGTN